MELAFSVDLEPNKDGSLTGVPGAMDWFDDVVPRGTVFATYRIATELPEVVERLSVDHEIGVHVHPREFGHDQDELAELDVERQRTIIDQTRTALCEAIDSKSEDVTAFRAGRHSCSLDTLDILADLGFSTDASMHVRYDDHLPECLTDRSAPFRLSNGLYEVPTTYIVPFVLSRVGLRVFPQRNVTATSTTVRIDRRGCSGELAINAVLDNAEVVSMYMHPYDATDYETDLDGNGAEFRERIERVIPEEEAEFVTVSDAADFPPSPDTVNLQN